LSVVRNALNKEVEEPRAYADQKKCFGVSVMLKAVGKWDLDAALADCA